MVDPERPVGGLGRGRRNQHRLPDEGRRGRRRRRPQPRRRAAGRRRRRAQGRRQARSHSAVRHPGLLRPNAEGLRRDLHMRGRDRPHRRVLVLPGDSGAQAPAEDGRRDGGARAVAADSPRLRHPQAAGVRRLSRLPPPPLARPISTSSSSVGIDAATTASPSTCCSGSG